jgi:hypothetical protein
MAKRKPMSVSEANAYRAKKEGDAVLITALMPWLLLVTGACIIILLVHFGLVDSSTFADLMSALLQVKKN